MHGITRHCPVVKSSHQGPKSFTSKPCDNFRLSASIYTIFKNSRWLIARVMIHCLELHVWTAFLPLSGTQPLPPTSQGLETIRQLALFVVHRLWIYTESSPLFQQTLTRRTNPDNVGNKSDHKQNNGGSTCVIHIEDIFVVCVRQATCEALMRQIPDEVSERPTTMFDISVRVPGLSKV